MGNNAQFRKNKLKHFNVHQNMDMWLKNLYCLTGKGILEKSLRFLCLQYHMNIILRQNKLSNIYFVDVNTYNNIKYANPEASEEEIIEASKQAHAHEFI